MKKNNLYQIGAVALVLAAGFFLYRKFVNGKKEQQPVAPEPITDLNENPLVDTVTGSASALTSSVAGLSQSVFGFLTNYNDYQVMTQTTGLNVRQKPDAKAKILGNLPKGSTIKAKASGVKGWFDVSKDGKSTYGYVSAQFLKAIPKQK
jgi:uncharacterized protein YgiM (DUF1202 family)